MKIYSWSVARCAMDCLASRWSNATMWSVGADTAAMLERGFQAVDRDFPVFRDIRKTGEEYALAGARARAARGTAGFDVRRRATSP